MSEITKKMVSGKPFGYSGTEIQNGTVDTGEWVTELQRPNLHQTVDYMRTEAIISALEKAYTYPIIQASTSVNYEKETITPEQDVIKDFCESQIKNLNLSSLYRNMLTHLPHGFSVQEIIWNTSGKYMGVERLEARKQETIDKFNVNKQNNLVSIEQHVFIPDGEQGGAWEYTPPIPIEKLVILAHEMENDNYTGRSMYRSIYREWKIKDYIMKQIAIVFERVGVGIPVAITGENSETTTPDITAIENVLRGLQMNEKAYGVLDKVKDIKLLSIDGKVLDSTKQFIQYLDESMAKSLLQLWLNLGTSQSGSRALGETFSDLYFQALEGVIEEIESALNEQLIKRLVDYNWGKQESYPKVQITLDRDMGVVYQLLGELKRSGVISGNTDIENWILKNFGLPITTGFNELKTEPAPEPIAASQGQVVDIEPTREPSGSCDCGHSHIELSTIDSPVSGSWKPRRKPTDVELSCGVQFENIANNLNNLKVEYADKLRRIYQPAMIAAAAELGQGKKVYQVDINVGNKGSDLFRKMFKDIQKVADQDIKDELSRQDSTKLSEIMLAETVPFNDKEYLAYMDEKANIESEWMRAESKKALDTYYDGALQKNLAGAALANAIIEQIRDEVGARYDVASGKALLGYAGAREISAKQFAETFDVKIRTSMFDDRVCEVCAEQDGEQFFLKDGEWWSSDETFIAPALPDPECESSASGSSRCRCLYIYTTGGGE